MFRFIRRLFGNDVTTADSRRGDDTELVVHRSSRSHKPCVSDTYFDTMSRMQAAVSNRDYEGAARLVCENLQYIPDWVNETRRDYGSFDIGSIPALQQGGTVLLRQLRANTSLPPRDSPGRLWVLGADVVPPRSTRSQHPSNSSKWLCCPAPRESRSHVLRAPSAPRAQLPNPLPPCRLGEGSEDRARRCPLSIGTRSATVNVRNLLRSSIPGQSNFATPRSTSGTGADGGPGGSGTRGGCSCNCDGGRGGNGGRGGAAGPGGDTGNIQVRYWTAASEPIVTGPGQGFRTNVQGERPGTPGSGGVRGSGGGGSGECGPWPHWRHGGGSNGTKGQAGAESSIGEDGTATIVVEPKPLI